MTQIPDLGTITVREIRDGLSTGKFTAEALTESALAHVKAMNPTFNAIIFHNDEAALETARDVDRRIAAGEPVGPLAGVPIVVKDPMDMKGVPNNSRLEKTELKIWRCRSDA